MSIRHPKEKKFLYFAGLMILLGLFDFYMLMNVVGKQPLGNVLIKMVLVNAVGFGVLGIVLFRIARKRSRQVRMQAWHDMIRSAVHDAHKDLQDDAGNK